VPDPTLPKALLIPFALGLLVLAATAVAWRLRFVQDDAYISFRYAENLAAGRGLVWNSVAASGSLAEPTEGYTNFLWTVAMGALMAVGAEPVAASYVLGLAAFAVTLAFTYKLGTRMLGSRGLGLWAVVLLGTNYSFLCFATGGMETQWQACLFAASFYLFVRGAQEQAWPIARLVALSMLLAAAVLTRLDSALLVAVVGAATLLLGAWARLPRREMLRKAAALALPFGAVVGGWGLWKLAYYGNLLPNTYAVKVASVSPFGTAGVRYLQAFLLSYCLVPFPLLGLLAARRRPTRSDVPWLSLAAIVGLWCLYIVRIGGDFIEFRFLVPVLPFAFVLILGVVFKVIQQRGVRAALLALVLFGSVQHAATFGRALRMGAIANRAELRAPLTDPSSDWVGIGKVLGRAFAGAPQPLIAVMPAGAIPYFSRLPAIDMLGLNDRWVARHGIPLEGMAGHARLAPLRYLVERRANLVLGHPIVKKAPDLPSAGYSLAWLRDLWWVRFDSPDEIPAEASILEIPLDDEWRVLAIYLTKSPAVDAVAQRCGWRIRPLLRT